MQYLSSMKHLPIIIFNTMLCLLCSFAAQAKPLIVTDHNPERIVAFATDHLIIRTQNGTSHTFKVEIAKTIPQLRQGLMHRTELQPKTGMLFLLSRERKMTMWMKNTLIPLDMLFIAKDGTITSIEHNAEPESRTYITSDAPVWAVLEINGGQAAKMGIAQGDKVRYQAFELLQP